MPGSPRARVVPRGQVGVYHCWNRCVRRALLCGQDDVTQTNYEYRRYDMRRVQKALASLFAIEICFHALMSNHLHLILRTRPDVARRWSALEVARRWLTITKLKRNGSIKRVDPDPAAVAALAEDAEKIERVRRRLSDVSWFMGALCENTSRRCNREDGCTGSFWEGRFKCRALLDEAAITICGVYVDLNQVRAREAATPEASHFTSAYDRIQARLQRERGRPAGWAVEGIAEDGGPGPDDWLCQLPLEECPGADPALWTSSATGLRASDKGLLPMSLEQYLELLDWTGRQVRTDKPGAIPRQLAPILERLGINGQHYVEAVTYCDRWFGHVMGHAKRVRRAAAEAGQRCFQGVSRCAMAFDS